MPHPCTGSAQYIKYLTPMRALWFFLNAPFRARRFFDSDGALSCNDSVLVYPVCSLLFAALPTRLQSYSIFSRATCHARRAYLQFPNSTSSFLISTNAGERLYADEFDRMFGRHARRTARLAQAAARRTSTLGLVYSLSMSASFLLIVMFGTWHPLSGQ